MTDQTSPPPSPLAGEGSDLPPSLRGKGARGLGSSEPPPPLPEEGSSIPPSFAGNPPFRGAGGARGLGFLRQGVDITLRLVAVFLAASLCSFVTVNQPVLRVLYDAVANYATFLMTVSLMWRAVGARVIEATGYSLLAIVTALAVSLVVGVPIGFLTGARPHSRLSGVVRVLSYLGSMTPSFLLALFIMVFFVLWVLPLTGIRFILVSSTVAEIDPRRLLPIALTLTARPLAYFAMITSAATRDALMQDFARTAYSKGLSTGQVMTRHIWPNVLPALLSAVPVTLLFTMSSLPIVEFVFNWPGVGRDLLFQVVSNPRSNQVKSEQVSFLLTSLGITYVLVSLGIESLRQRLDPLALREER